MKGERDSLAGEKGKASEGIAQAEKEQPLSVR